MNFLFNTTGRFGPIATCCECALHTRAKDTFHPRPSQCYMLCQLHRSSSIANTKYAHRCDVSCHWESIFLVHRSRYASLVSQSLSLLFISQNQWHIIIVTQSKSHGFIVAYRETSFNSLSRTDRCRSTTICAQSFHKNGGVICFLIEGVIWKITSLWRTGSSSNSAAADSMCTKAYKVVRAINHLHIQINWHYKQ
jgi:hypothetical protein